MKSTAFAAVAACLLSLSSSPVSAQPLILNGAGPQNVFVNEGVIDYSPAPIYVGYGSGEDARNTVIEQVNTSLDSGGPGYVAYSNGTGQHNTVVWNLDGDSSVQMGFNVDGLANVLGYDGSVTINVDGHNAPNGGVFQPAPISGAWGNLRTERATLAAREGSSATINLKGPHANWYAWSRHIDIGPMGRAEVNISEGAGLVEAQRIAVGGSRWGFTSTDATTGELIFPDGFGGEGYLTLDGPGSLIQFADDDNGWLRVGRHAKGEMIVSNGAVVDGVPDTAGIQIYVGEQPNGEGRLIIESGGIVNMSGILRIISSNAEASSILVDGPGSQLNMRGDVGTISYIGHSGTNMGTLEVLNGGSAVFRSDEVNRSLRIANQEGTSGEVIVDGEGSILEVGNFFQTGYGGNGTAKITNGGRLIAGDEGNGLSSIGRQATGHGTLIVDGPGSRATFHNSLHMAAATDVGYLIDDEGTGTGVLEVKNGGIVEVGGHLATRGTDYQIITEVEGGDDIVENFRSSGTILLDNGTIRMTGFDPVSVGGQNASLTGEGLIDGDLLVGNGALVAGTGNGITVTGNLSGYGVVENLTVGGVRVTTDMGLLTLNNVDFSDDAVVNVAITNLSEVTGLLAYDSNTSLAGTHLEISVEVWVRDPDYSAQILAAGVDHGFASVTVPEGFRYENGLLTIDGDILPPPPMLVSIYTAAHSNDSWTQVANWDTESFPDSALHLAQFSEPVDTDRVNMLATSGLLSVPTVHQTAGILVKDGFVANPVSDGNFLFRNSSTGTPGFLRLHGFGTEIDGNPATGLVANFSDQDISFSTVNASFHIELAGTGHFHVEKPDVQTRVIVGITELEDTSHGIIKSGKGILHFGAEAQHNDFSGPFILEEGIVQWTNSGSASGPNPFGMDSLVLRGGVLRSNGTGGRLINTAVVLDGNVTIGAEETFTGQMTANSSGGTLVTTIASDSTMNILSTVIWHQGTVGDHALTITGTDKITFTGSGGAMKHTGDTIVESGLLRINTTVENSKIIVKNGGSLGFGLNTDTGQAMLNTDLILEAGSNLVFRIDGTYDYDFVTSVGTLTLGGAELVIELDYQPQVGNTFTLVENWAWKEPIGTLSYKGMPLTNGREFYVQTGEFSHWFEITYSESGSVVIQAVEGGVPPSDAYSDWAGAFGLSGSDAAIDANPAGDGFTNLQKFAFGLNPTVPAASLADVSREGDLLVLRWNQRIGGIEYVVEASGSLAADSWTVVPNAEPVLMSNPDVTPPAGYERVEWTVDVSGEGDRSFYRASASVDANLLP